ncbi:MAG: NAD(P)/FAD-dependent oxidoreductase [Anaerolineaceae bacterium]|nr:NAD(P)/FAD-dependent oxidoreductase [Anaerolineaceae bacterium]
MAKPDRPRIVIIGAGFGGLYAARTLAKQPVDVLLIDRRNFHTFTPLLYQVATCGLDPSEIAYPVRTIFRDVSNVRFMLGEVTSLDATDQIIEVQSDGATYRESYDYLILATGSVTNYFGMADLESNSFGLKDLSDAVVLRNHLLKQFERAAWSHDPAYRDALTTIVIVGGGPTGLETAGALCELYNYVLHKEYRDHTFAVRVILIEASDRLLAPYPESLQKAAVTQLESLGVEVMLESVIDHVTGEGAYLRDGRFIPTRTLVWAAGVKASPIGDLLGVPLGRAGRVPVEQTLEAIGHERIYVVGDLAYLENERGEPYPMLIPVAKQQGVLAAQNIMWRIQGEAQKSFHYTDRGLMATIGRRRAVAWLYYRVQLQGFMAWATWLSAHLVWLLGFRNRFSVFFSWVWNYLTYDRSVRIILEHRGLGDPAQGNEMSTTGLTTVD